MNISDLCNGDETSPSNTQDQRRPDPYPQDYHRQQQQHPQQPPPPPSPAHPGLHQYPSHNPRDQPIERDPVEDGPHQTPYEQHGGYPSNIHEPFYGGCSSSVPAKKKNTRASQACDNCRHLKAKCDEMKPCRTCEEKRVECKYRDPVPKATDKAQADILEGLSSVQTSLNLIMTHLGRFEQRLIKMESLLPRHTATSTLKTESSVEDQMEVEPGPLVSPGEPAIPINHMTLAGLLLEWPSIRELTKHHVEREGVRFISEYPISQEQNRGVLMVYGQGEDGHPSRQVREPTDHGHLDMADDSSDTASPSPAADWGQLGGLSPPDQVEYKGGVLVDGNPDFSEPKVGEYVESFKKNILNMHPIIEPKLLDNWVRHFLDNLPASQPRPAKPQTSKPTFAVGGGSQTEEVAGSKRKRSPGPDGSEPPPPAPSRTGRPDRSIHTALVLTVLALGSVCLHRDNIPDAVLRNGAIPPPSDR
ncbi:hypothetical protein FLAG1_10993, partial [Fusarium langsethiae]